MFIHNMLQEVITNKSKPFIIKLGLNIKIDKEEIQKNCFLFIQPGHFLYKKFPFNSSGTTK